jgi:drug/metabolite transporter (DMT)-like permease
LLALAQFFVDLCLLRRAPQDLPASNVLFGLALAADLAVGLLLTFATGLSPASGFPQTLAEILFMLVLLRVALVLTNHTQRFSQAATALLGSGVVLGLLAILPVSLVAGGEQNGQSAVAALLFLMLLVWSILVSGHILRHTFDIRLGQGAAIAVIYNLLAYGLMRGLFSGS